MIGSPWRQAVLVPRKFVERCLSFGDRFVDHFDHGGSPQSRAYTMNNAHKNHALQSFGKVGEVAAALFFGLDPEATILWKTSQGPDDGHDFVVNGIRVDSKTSYPKGNLIWPLSKNAIYLSKKFDVMVSVSVSREDYTHCWIEGYIPKYEFFARKQIAEPGFSNLQPGTWFMAKHILYDPQELFDDRALIRHAIRSGHQFEYISGRSSNAQAVVGMGKINKCSRRF